MDFNFFKKYSDYETLASWQNLLSKNEWLDFIRLTENDCVRWYNERKNDWARKNMMQQKVFDQGFYGKCSEIRIANMFKREGFNAKSIMLNNLNPDGDDLLPGEKRSNKYLDLWVDGEFYEIKTILLYVKFNKNFAFNEYFMKRVIDTLEKLKDHKYESLARYVIFNTILYHYNASESNTEFNMLFKNWSKCSKRNYASSDYIFNVRTQDLFVYDVKTKKIVYINEDSCLFKPIPIDEILEITPGRKAKPYCINISNKFTKDELCGCINGL